MESKSRRNLVDNVCLLGSLVRAGSADLRGTMQLPVAVVRPRPLRTQPVRPPARRVH